MAESTFEISKVQEVLRDLDSCRIPSLASPGSSSATFFPPSISRRFDRSRLYDVLRSIPSTEGRAAQLARDIVKRDCVKVFLILLRMDHPAMILHFLRNDTLSDRYLPLGRSENFPVGIQFDEFNDHQQPYCAPTIREGHVDFPNHRVLPLIGREELAQGGSAKVYKITIHPDFDGLDVDDEARIVVCDTRTSPLAITVVSRLQMARTPTFTSQKFSWPTKQMLSNANRKRMQRLTTRVDGMTACFVIMAASHIVVSIL